MNPIVSWPVALACARERLRAGPTVVLAGLLVLGGTNMQPELGGADLFGGSGLGAGFRTLLLLLFTLFLGGGLIADELESGHAQLVLLRPVPRSAWFGGRLCGAGLLLAAAVLSCWLLGVGRGVVAGRAPALPGLVALPLALVWAFSWLSLLALLSTVAKGFTNVGWLVVGALLFGLVWMGVNATHSIALAAHSAGPLGERVYALVSAVAPYVGPIDPGKIPTALRSGVPADWTPLLYDVAFAAGCWWLGVWSIGRRELARRRG